jgi:hypothetical protein
VSQNCYNYILNNWVEAVAFSISVIILRGLQELSRLWNSSHDDTGSQKYWVGKAGTRTGRGKSHN